MLERKKQIENSMIYMLPIGMSGLAFITIPIFTRILTPEDFGLLALAMIYASFSNGFVNLGMTIAFERNYFQYSKDKRKMAQLLFSSLVFVSVNFRSRNRVDPAQKRVDFSFEVTKKRSPGFHRYC